MAKYYNADGDVGIVDLSDKVDEVREKVEALEDIVLGVGDHLTTLQTALTSEEEPNIVNLPHTIQSGHNMFGYTGTNGVDVTEAFFAATGGNQSIIDRISICKDQTGTFWIPNVWNGLGSMVYGTGYYLYNTGDPFQVTWI